MSSIVTVTAADSPVDVISEKIIDDGRERLVNGIDRVEAGESQQFVLHAKQSIRIMEAVLADDAPTSAAPTIGPTGEAA